MGLSAEEEAAEAAGHRRRRRGEEQLVAWLDVEPAPALATSVQAVMAPALTEAGPQKPENLIPALPKAGFLSAEQANQVCQNREVLAQFVVSANVQPTTIDEQCLQGLPKDLLSDVIKLKFGGLEGLSELIGVAAASAVPQPCARLSKPAAAAAADLIMSGEQRSMAEPAADSMCFYSQSVVGSGQVSSSNNSNSNNNDNNSNTNNSSITGNNDDDDIDHIAEQVAKEQSLVDDDPDKQQQLEDERSLEQIMGFDSDIGVPPGDISQNVEDILQVIKSMESAETGDSIGGDNRLTGGCGSLIDGGSSQSTVEGVSEMFPDGEAFPLNLLNDMDVMNLVNDNIADSVVADHQPSSQPLQQSPTKHTELAQQQAQIERRQHDLERRASFLSRRLRKLQSQLVGEHVAEEASHVLELAQQSAKKCFYQDLASLGPKAGNTRNFPELAGSLSSFLQKVQKSCNAQSNSIAVRQRNSCRYFGAGSKDNYVNPTANRIPVFGVPQIKLDGEQVERVAGPLATKLKILQSAYDSDCTASSSGGESCDEMQTFNNPHQQSLPIAKRAGWRYAQDRASVASRWTWLQAQISDLEYKIRQHNELQRQIRASKGLIILEASPPPAAADSSTVNGYSGALPGSRVASTCTSDPTSSSSPAAAANYGASRTRPYVRHLYRKRKLVQLDGLHEVSKKAARPATIRCSCDGGMAPCAVCTGRKEPTASQASLDLLSVQERIAAVDPGYHPVLSLPDEVPHTVHMDAIMRIPEWQQKMLRGGMRMAKIKDKDSNERRNKKVAEQRVKYPATAKKSQSISLGARIKRKALKGKRSQSTSERPNHGLSSGGGGSTSSRKRSHGGSKVPAAHQQQQQQPSAAQPAVDDEEEASALSSSSKYSSPVPSPLLSGQTAQAPEKSAVKERSNSHSHSRLRQNSYDIDNIVIPYSVAASTRLEKLPYKEILIPKWRLCEDPPSTDVKNGAVQKPGVDNDFEDISEEMIAARHERGGLEEFKRYEKNSKLPHHSRIRHSRRTDSRTDSGANTPDPMSPHASDFGGDTMSPITSPPATPSTPQDPDHPETHHRPGSLQTVLRRRTISSSVSRLQREESNTSTTEEHEQVLPYEPRTFPLTDEDYSKMVEAMPSGHLLPPSAAPSVSSQGEEKIDEPEVDSQSDSTESAMCDMEGEDPNDPEWTVAEARDTEKERIRPTAKR